MAVIVKLSLFTLVLFCLWASAPGDTVPGDTGPSSTNHWCAPTRKDCRRSWGVPSGRCRRNNKWGFKCRRSDGSSGGGGDGPTSPCDPPCVSTCTADGQEQTSVCDETQKPPTCVVSATQACPGDSCTEPDARGMQSKQTYACESETGSCKVTTTACTPSCYIADSGDLIAAGASCEVVGAFGPPFATCFRTTVTFCAAEDSCIDGTDIARAESCEVVDNATTLEARCTGSRSRCSGGCVKNDDGTITGTGCVDLVCTEWGLGKCTQWSMP